MSEITLADHAEQWHLEHGRTMPSDRSLSNPLYKEMYEQWVNWAFQDFRESL